MWVCPNCQRCFKRADQTHTCKPISKDDLFSKRPPFLKNLFEKIEAIVSPFGEYREETVLPDVIYFKTASTFMAVKVKKSYLELEFFLSHLENVPPVVKFLKISKNRVVHVVRVVNERHIDEQFMGWIKESYILIGKS